MAKETVKSAEVLELEKQIAALKAEKASLLANAKPLVEEGFFKGHRTFTVNAPGKMPFSMGESKLRSLYSPEIMAVITELLAKPKPFDSK